MKPGGVGNTTAKTAKDIAKNIAKQVAEEPFEILKEAGNQMAGLETKDSQTNSNSDKEASKGEETKVQEMKDKVFAERRMQALQNEIDDIRKQEVFKDLQAKIAQGVDVSLEEFTELSMEQKQVLKAQMEAVKFQKQQAKYQASVQEVPSVSSKPSRRFGAGQKHEAEKAQTRVEKPVPPSQ